MNKNFTLKCMALFAFTLMGFKAQAQYYADGTILNATKSLIVDTNGGSEPTGTTGSWYKWTTNNGASYISATSTNAPTGSINKDTNKADVTWNASWPSAPASGTAPTAADIAALIQDYKITAEEFNSCQPNSSTANPNPAMTEIDVKLVKPDVLFIDADSDVCSTAKANITLYGTSGAVVNYTINGGNVTAGGTNTSATLNSDGKIDIEITPSGTGDVIFVINNVTYTATQPGPLSTQVTFTNSTITNAAGKTVTIKLSAGPVISPIVF
ncbi:hypothetical protein HX001_14920 [Empedobacter brevis]|uniref:Uncharacterized protein n=1 Tax=Empedobacter brevis TaxID=247 RepID=A0AAJ1QGW4_9FLAO|nr:hypothetical protein [Empedobacter brevis]MDM1073779.1 hypothetical protein [Empedobacter brevis]